MAQNTQISRKVIREFLLIYRNEPCLWQVNNESYHNRAKKNAALDKLVEKYKEIDKNADREMVTKKINGLRSTYNYEKRKVDAAKRLGDTYQPTFWYFRDLSFIDSANASSSTIKEEKEENRDEEEKDYIIVNIAGDKLQHNPEDISNSGDNLQTDEPVQSTSSRSKPKKRKYECLSDPLAGNDQYNHPGEVSEDHHDIYCKYVASKLRAFPRDQRILAERLINDVIFEAEWGNLSVSHKIVNTESLSTNAHYSPSPSSQ